MSVNKNPCTFLHRVDWLLLYRIKQQNEYILHIDYIHFGITCDICILIAAISGVIYSQIAPFYALNRIFFPVNETALLKHNNQLNFKA